jgi:hypothetical protein
MPSIHVHQGWLRVATAALALASWYMMVPDGKGVILPNGVAFVTTFNSRGDCENAVEELRAQGYDSAAIDARDDPGNRALAEKAWQEENAECVATIDDTRLTGN